MIADYALDGALDRVRQADRLDLCSQRPASFAQLETFSIATCRELSISEPMPLLLGAGRRVSITPGDGTATKRGAPNVWVLSANGQILASDATKDAPMLAAGMKFRAPPFDVELEA